MQIRHSLFALFLALAGALAWFPPVALAATCAGVTATITGAGAINGTAGSDVILGSAGADTILGQGGDDGLGLADQPGPVLQGGGQFRRPVEGRDAGQID